MKAQLTRQDGVVTWHRRRWLFSCHHQATTPLASYIDGRSVANGNFNHLQLFIVATNDMSRIVVPQ